MKPFSFFVACSILPLLRRSNLSSLATAFTHAPTFAATAIRRQQRLQLGQSRQWASTASSDQEKDGNTNDGLPKQYKTRLVPLLPSGRVEDPDKWLRLCCNSLEQLTGKTIMDYMTSPNVTTLEEVHNEEQYAFLSHGSQDDPIFCYFNKAALEMFQYDEQTEIYHLPSRYSAPSGAARSSRQAVIDGTAQSEDLGYYNLPPVVRQVKNGDLFEISEILLWNVFDEQGYRVGQAAIYNRAKAKWVGNEPRPSAPTALSS